VVVAVAVPAAAPAPVAATLKVNPPPDGPSRMFRLVVRSAARLYASNGHLLQNTTGNPFTGGLTINGMTSVGFTADNQLGAAGGNITFGGGRLAYNLAADLTTNRNIRLGPSGGGFTFNVAATGGRGCRRTATATTTLTLGGVISGPGTFFKEGTGVVKLNGTNNYLHRRDVGDHRHLQFTTDANLGAAGTKIFLTGGHPPAARGRDVHRPIDVSASSTILTNAKRHLLGQGPERRARCTGRRSRP